LKLVSRRSFFPSASATYSSVGLATLVAAYATTRRAESNAKPVSRRRPPSTSRTSFVRGDTWKSASRPPTEAHIAMSPLGSQTKPPGSYCQPPRRFSTAPVAMSTV
jgi:hypothetical protein